MHIGTLLRCCAKIEMMALTKQGVAAGFTGLANSNTMQRRQYRATHVVQATAAPSKNSIKKAELVKLIQSRVEESGAKVTQTATATIIDAVFDTIVDEVG